MPDDRIGAAEFQNQALVNLGLTSEKIDAGDAKQKEQIRAEMNRLNEEFKKQITAFENENKELVEEMDRIDKANESKLEEIEESFSPHYLMLSDFPETVTKELSNYIAGLSSFIFDDTYGQHKPAQLRSLPLQTQNGSNDKSTD